MRHFKELTSLKRVYYSIILIFFLLQDKSNKVFFIWLIDQRKKLLKKLRKEDLQRYTDIIEELGIPPLADPNDPKIKYKFRKFKINVPLKKKRELHEFEYDRNY